MQCVTLVRHRVRKEVTILSITLFSEAEEWCLALRDAKPENIGDGVKIVDFSEYNGKTLACADGTWTSNILFCRERTNTLFEAVMDKLKTGTTKPNGKDGGKVLVTGAPGIGKSAMLYRVMREAFQQKRTVVFDRRQQREALIFLPKNSSYECWRYKSPTPRAERSRDLSAGRPERESKWIRATNHPCSHSHHRIVEPCALSTIYEEPT
jgi:hypothetical protein